LHIEARPKGAGDQISNLRPLQWKNNAAKADKGRLVCAVTSAGNMNVDVKQ
jgi:hypothetical protein